MYFSRLRTTTIGTHETRTDLTPVAEDLENVLVGVIELDVADADEALGLLDAVALLRTTEDVNFDQEAEHHLLLIRVPETDRR